MVAAAMTTTPDRGGSVHSESEMDLGELDDAALDSVSTRPLSAASNTSRPSEHTSLLLDSLNKLQNDLKNDEDTKELHQQSVLNTVLEDVADEESEQPREETTPKSPSRASRNRNPRFDFIKRESLYNLATCMSALEEDIDDIQRKSILDRATKSMSRIWGRDSEFFEDNQALDELQRELEEAHLSDDSGDKEFNLSEEDDVGGRTGPPQDTATQNTQPPTKKQILSPFSRQLEEWEGEAQRGLDQHFDSVKDGLDLLESRRESEMKQLRQENESLKAQLVQEADQRSSNLNEQKGLQNEVRSLKQEVATLQAKYDERLELEKANQKSFEETRKEALEQLQKDKQRLETQLKASELSSRDLRKSQELQEQDQLLQEAAIQDLKQQVSTLEAVNLKHLEEVKHLKSQLRESKSTIDLQRSQEQDERRRQDEEVRDLESQINDIRTNYDNLLKSEEDSKRTLAETTRKVQDQNESLKRQLEDIELGRGPVDSPLQKARQNQRRKSLDLMKQLSDIKASYSDELSKSESLDEETEQGIREENASLKRQLNQAHAALEKLKGQALQNEQYAVHHSGVEDEAPQSAGNYKLLLLRQENDALKKRLENNEKIELDRLYSSPRIDKFRQSLVSISQQQPEQEVEEGQYESVGKSVLLGEHGEEEDVDSTSPRKQLFLEEVQVQPSIEQRASEKSSLWKPCALILLVFILGGGVALYVLRSPPLIVRHNVVGLKASSVPTKDESAASIRYEKTLAKLQSEKDVMGSQLKGARKSVEDLQKELVGAKEFSDKLKDDHTALRKELDAVKTENNQLDKRFQKAQDDFEKKLKSLQQESAKKIQMLESENFASQAKLRHSETELKEAKARLLKETFSAVGTKEISESSQKQQDSLSPVRAKADHSTFSRLTRKIMGKIQRVPSAARDCVRDGVNGIKETIREQRTKAMVQMIRARDKILVIVLKAGNPERVLHSSEEAWLHVSGSTIRA